MEGKTVSNKNIDRDHLIESNNVVSGYMCAGPRIEYIKYGIQKTWLNPGKVHN